jgi:hypothetical protein
VSGYLHYYFLALGIQLLSATVHNKGEGGSEILREGHHYQVWLRPPGKGCY